MHASNHVSRFLASIGFCIAATLAQAAGLRGIDIPTDAEGPAIHGVIWYPCTEPPREIHIDIFTLPAVPNCPIAGDHLPLIAFSHGQGAGLLINHDTAETLADRGFIVAAINHPGDNVQDLSRTDDLAGFVERPTDSVRHRSPRESTRTESASSASRAVAMPG
jgi:predicted dienelactone hydrolase